MDVLNVIDVNAINAIMVTSYTMGNVSTVLILNVKSAIKMIFVWNVNLAIMNIKAVAINAKATAKSAKEACSVHHANQDTN
jgi:hypothetical protein